jgi:hypothetical protein
MADRATCGPCDDAAVADVTWRAVAFLAVEVDAPWGGGILGRGSNRLRRSMSAEEMHATVDVLERVPAAVSAWSEDHAALHMLAIRRIDEPVRRLTPIVDGRWWLGPDDVPASAWRSLRPGAVDSVFVLWPSDGVVPLCGWGCTVGPSASTLGAGFSSIVSDGWAGYPARLHPEEGFVHEWLHQVEGVLRGRGVGTAVLPNLHDVDGRTSCRPAELPPHGRTYPEHHARTDTWQPWYRDLMTGTVRGRDPGEPRCLGLRPKHWRISRP